MNQPKISTSDAIELAEDHGSNASANPTLGDIVATRLSRRDLGRGLLAVSAVQALLRTEQAKAGPAEAVSSSSPAFAFEELEAGFDATHHVAPGYDADVLIRWGDAVVPGAPAFNPGQQTAAAQAQQFGYNNDFLGFFPIDGKSDHGLLVVNHEYTSEELMFPGIVRQDKDVKFAGMTADLVAIEMMAHGGSVLEIQRKDGKWGVVPDSRYARRITAETVMRISGPASGHAKMKTGADASGRTVLGMVNNCAGATTPWGTWLSCEEVATGRVWEWFMANAAPERALALVGMRKSIYPPKPTR